MPSRRLFIHGIALLAAGGLSAVARAAATGDTIDTDDFLSMVTGVRFRDIVRGTGPQPKKGQKVTVNYTGWLFDDGKLGRKFDASADHGQPLTFTLGAGEVIPGWDQGVSTMRVGGKRRLILPPSLAYGEHGAGGGVIPPNATLVFDVELLSIG